MPRHVFEVNVPNPTARPIKSELRLKRASKKDLVGIAGIPDGALKIVAMGLSTDPCANSGKDRKTIALSGFESRDVQVLVETAQSRSPAVAGVHLIDRRNGRDVGGVLLIVTNPPLANSLGTIVAAQTPCPAELARDLYAVPAGDDPGDFTGSVPVRAGQPVELVAAITNSTAGDLDEATVYLEHLGLSGVRFEPGTWNIGTLAKGATFFAAWRITVGPGRGNIHMASIVVESKGTEPTRLTAKFAVAGRDD